MATTAGLAQENTPSPTGRDLQPKVCFNACRKESYVPTRGFKTLHRKLKQFCVVDVNKEDVALEKLLPYDMVIFGTPQEQLSDSDLRVVKEYVERGGSVLLTLGDGNGGKFSSYNKPFDEWFGITCNEDCVVRTVLHKYFHPKEVCVTNGITNREINRAAGKNVIGATLSKPTNYGGSTLMSASSSSGGGTRSGSNAPTTATTSGTTSAGGAAPNIDGTPAAASSTLTSLSFVYPYGLTLNVQRPAIPILSSGFMAYPLNRPVSAVWESPEVVDHNGQRKSGKFMVIGTGLLLEDAWLNKEENDKLATVLIDYLLHHIRLNRLDADEPDITDYHYLPDTHSMSDRLRVAVEESEQLPRDFTKLFDFTTFKLDTAMIPEVVGTYQKLSLKHEPLTLISPEFQAPLPPCLPATFDPTHREPAAPALDLFDLDEHFAPERVRLSQLTNKCQSEDLEFYITEGAEIIGVTKKLRSPRNKDPRALLDHIFRQVLQYKKSNQSGGGGGGGGPDSNTAANNNLNSGGPPLPGSGVGANLMAVGSGGGGVVGPSMGSSAAGGGGARVLRVACGDDGAADATPFERNTPWTLTLQIDTQAGTIQGTILLQNQSMDFPQQQCVIQGNISPPGAREYAMEWGCMVVNTMGQQVPFVFLANHSGHTLRGVCENPGTANRWNFMYLTEDV